MSNFTATQGEDIVLHDSRDGAIASHVSEISAGGETLSTSVSRSAFREAMKSDCGDSYPSAYVWTDGETLAVTDHRTAKMTPNTDRLEEFGKVDIVRMAAVETPPEANGVLVYRDATVEALDELAVECVTVHVETDAPLVIEGEGSRGVAIAPRVKPSNLTEVEE
mgnify:CR=1 FL=1